LRSACDQRCLPVCVLLYADSSRLAARLSRRLARRGLRSVDAGSGPIPRTREPGSARLAVVLPRRSRRADRAGTIDLLRDLEAEGVPALVRAGSWSQEAESGPLIEWLPERLGLDELVGKITTAAHYAPLIQALEHQRRQLRRLGEQLNRHFGQIDQELRLAGRLQRDFLPPKLPALPGYDFQVLYRPASWVSGDMYDVFRIDEHHVGMLVADAMGHGMAAGLMTMFLRQALVAKRLEGSSYRVVPPTETLAELHHCLLRRNLPDSQFVTAVYAVLDIRCGRLELARAGHPYPLHVRKDGSIAEVGPAGPLLGLAQVPGEFEPACLTLTPGDKVIFYTDGLEGLIRLADGETDNRSAFNPQFSRWAAGSAAELVREISGRLDRQEGSLHPDDDVTVLVLEVEPAA